jgi:phosphatidylserine decarboxylase
MVIHKEGFKIIPYFLAALVVVNLAILLVSGYTTFFYLVLIFSAVLLAVVFWFFRDPGIVKSAVTGEVLSAADGRVVTIEPVIEPEYFNGRRIQVSVFMSIFNVHMNHFPVEGEIVYQKHHNGKFKPANLAKSSGKNERCTTVIRTESGQEILVRQIAGILARRIVTYKGAGDKVKWNDQLGFIRFGSRVDIFLPVNANVKVRINQVVKGGVTVIAVI